MESVKMKYEFTGTTIEEELEFTGCGLVPNRKGEYSIVELRSENLELDTKDKGTYLDWLNGYKIVPVKKESITIKVNM